MNRDIDLGGPGYEDYEEEDVIPIEAGEVEVLEEEAPIEPPVEPMKAPPAAAKEPSKWVKRILIVVVIIALIGVIIMAFLYFTTEVSDIIVTVPDDPDHPDELRVDVEMGTTGTASVAGKADLEITYGNDVVYQTKVSINDDGSGTIYVPYNSFVEGNGYYYVTAKYRGKESIPAEYEVRYIVEKVEIDVFTKRVGDDGVLNLTVHMLDKNGNYLDEIPKEVIVTVDKITLTDNNFDLIDGDESEPISANDFRKDYTYYPDSEPGNYSIEVSVKNTMINPDSGSPYNTITGTWPESGKWKGYLNILPIADLAEPVTSDPNPFDIYYTVEFDASNSWNDGGITLYKWDPDGDGDFDDETTTPTYTYDFLIKGQDYNANLNIVGDVIDPGDPDDISDDAIEVGAIQVFVESP